MVIKHYLVVTLQLLKRCTTMMTFKIYAGNMFVGRLAVIPGHSHSFLNRDFNVICAAGVVGKVASYKHLKLVRV